MVGSPPRVLAEKDNPRADVLWGLSGASVSLLDSMGLLQPYTPKGVDQIKPTFKSTKDPLAWTGMDTWLTVMCFNTVESAKRKLPKPESWADLVNPVYKDGWSCPTRDRRDPAT